MNLSTGLFFKKNFFLILFFIFSFSYGYSIFIDYVPYHYALKPFIIPSLIVHYLLTAKNKNLFFITALFFAFLGDLFFSIITDYGFLYGMCSFLVFNLFMMVIVSEKAGEIKISNLFLIIMPFLILLVAVIYFFFKNVGSISILFAVYGLILAILSSFCAYYYVKTKSKIALYFFIASVLFIIAGLSKGLKDFDVNTYFLRATNSIAYTFSLYFFYRAMVTERVIINNSDLLEHDSVIN